MAYRKVAEENLTAIADAIRAKSGGSDGLVFPDGFLSALESIDAGGGGGGVIVGTFTPSEDTSSITIPGVEYANKHILVIAFDSTSGNVTSGHFRIGMDIGVTRVSRYYSSTMNEYSPHLMVDGEITVNKAYFQAGIRYRYLYTKELW